MRCEASDPYSRVTLRCIRDVGHEPPHRDAFGDDFGVDDQDPSDPHLTGCPRCDLSDTSAAHNGQGDCPSDPSSGRAS